ncbi:hypothetical protein [Paludisphaera mucosa]|uniref:Double zinc ribbon n=1 Tax=Paludisphaera mucosa TaxID=3030827 RepID=A0ABT6FJV0_9BACT|nr:hypothetical protein [Paludisphaera mucosa]MDG3007660.1 hypothetical protein [Paludisphaera mucosa]
MARVTCRCGEVLDVDRNGPERVVCPRCQARIRVRRPETRAGAVPGGDGLIRFPCPCGRRLKVRAEDRPEAGRCPDCGRVVPVPRTAWAPGVGAAIGAAPKSPGLGVSNASFGGDGEARTEELDADDVARLQRWAARHGVLPGDAPSSPVPTPRLAETPYSPPPALRVEAGLRICPKCGRPLHMSAVACRACGASTPKA